MNDVDGLVRDPLKAKLDASAKDHWPDLADSLSDHHRVFRFCLRAGASEEGATKSCDSVCDQFRCQPDFYADSVRAAKPAAGCGRYSDRLGDDHLDDGRDLEAPQMGRCGSGAVLCLGFDSDNPATQHDMDELGIVIA